MSKNSDQIDQLLSQTPTHYKRFRFNGVTRYTSIETGNQTLEQETIVIIQPYFKDGREDRLIPKYKLGYINLDGTMGLRLALQPGALSPHQAETPSIPLKATVPSPDSPSTKELGGLLNAYEIETNGAVEMWSTVPWTREMCWRYTEFWGFPVVRPIDEGNAIKKYIDGKTNLFVDGWGHQIDNHLVRTMAYSKIENSKPVTLFVRSSELEAVSIEDSNDEFEYFFG